MQTLYAYDAQGNTTGKSKPGELMEYDYDDANRMVEFRTGGNRTTYEYNVDGIRTAQTTFAGSTSTETQYLVDGNHAYAQVAEEWISENNASAKLGAVFSYGDDIISQVRCTPNSATTCVNASYTALQADGFGSTRALTNVASTISDRREFDAFGVEIAREGSIEIEHLYRGEAFDDETGLYYLRARWMDPSVGRFVTQDSFSGLSGQPRSLHKYQYTGNDPVNGIDPTGFMTMIELSTAERASVQMVMNQVREYGFDFVSDRVMKALGGNLNTSIQVKGNAAGAGLLAALVLACKASHKSCLLRGIPTFISGFSTPASSIHVAVAQTGNGMTTEEVAEPLPFFLVRGFGRDDVDPRRGKKGCPGNLKAAVCDEYPFASTLQGGNKNYKAGRVSLMWVPKREGPKQGGELSAFYRSQSVAFGTPFLVTGLPFMPTSYIDRLGHWKKLGRK